MGTQNMARRVEPGTIPNLSFKGKIFDSEFIPETGSEWITKRNAKYEVLAANYHQKQSELERKKIIITLPDGKEVEGISNVTTPFDIALGISRNLSKQVCVC